MLFELNWQNSYEYWETAAASLLLLETNEIANKQRMLAYW